MITTTISVMTLGSLLQDTTFYPIRHFHTSFNCNYIRTSNNWIEAYAIDIAQNFGFKFGGDEISDVTPTADFTSHPIWNTPHKLSKTRAVADGVIEKILDTTNVKVLGNAFIPFFGFSPPIGDIPAIVVNKNLAFNGGKVLGASYNAVVGCDNDPRMLENVISFMQEAVISQAPVPSNSINVALNKPVVSVKKLYKSRICF